VKTAATHAVVHFGVLCDNRQLQMWQLECLEQLQSLPGAVLTVLLVHRPSHARRAGGLFRYLGNAAREVPPA